MLRVEYFQRLPLRCRCLFTWHCLRYSPDTSYCITFRTLSITHSSVFLVNHSIPRISTQQWISGNMFTFRPMLRGTFLLNLGREIPRKSVWYRFWDTRVHTHTHTHTNIHTYIYICKYIYIYICIHTYTYTHTYIHTYIRKSHVNTYIYIHIYIYTYRQTVNLIVWTLSSHRMVTIFELKLCIF
jgi:hypothetical protein